MQDSAGNEHGGGGFSRAHACGVRNLARAAALALISSHALGAPARFETELTATGLASARLSGPAMANGRFYHHLLPICGITTALGSRLRLQLVFPEPALLFAPPGFVLASARRVDGNRKGYQRVLVFPFAKSNERGNQLRFFCMISVPVAQKRIQELLVGFPASVTSAYLRFAETGDPASLDVVVLGVLQFYLAKKPAAPLADMPGSTRLIKDLGCDSLTMMDTVFMVESLFDLKLDDADLPSLTTLDDLRTLLHRHVKGNAAPAA